MTASLHSAIRTIPDFPSEGIQFKDITPILARADLVRLAVAELVKPWKDQGITKVVGIESRGFILGAMIAEALDAGFIPVRKEGKLPFTTIKETYELEYGTDTIEMHIDAVDSDDRVLIHDDVIATGGTAAATHRLLEFAGARTVGFSFLVELTALNGRDLLDENLSIHALLSF